MNNLRVFSLLIFLGFALNGFTQNSIRKYNDSFGKEISLVEKTSKGKAAEIEVNNLLTDWNSYLKKDINSLNSEISSDIPEPQKEFLSDEKQQLEKQLASNLARLNGQELPVETETITEEVNDTNNVEGSTQSELAEELEKEEEIDVPTEAESELKLIEGIVYKIQIAALSKEKKPEDLQAQFGINTEIEKEKINGLFKYVIGSFSSLEEAKFAKENITVEGINPFIVAYKDGIRIPLSDIGLD